MPASLNKVFIIGNLTRDPELRYTPASQPVTSFSVAVNRQYADQSGGKKEEVTFLRVVAWAKLAEVCNEYLRKGSSVFVEGRLSSRNWQAQDGSKRTTVEIVAQSVQFLSKPQGAKTSEPAATADAGEKQEMIIDDSFNASAPAAKPMNISPDELAPDSDVPF